MRISKLSEAVGEAIISIGEYFIYGCVSIFLICLIIFIIYFIGNTVTLFILGDRSPFIIVITSIICFIGIIVFGFAIKEILTID